MSLLEATRNSFYKEIIENEEICKITKSKLKYDLNKIILVDSQTISFLRETIRQSELTDNGFITVQNIEVNLQPIPIHIFCLIEPTDVNIDLLIKHFNNENCPFLSCHIFSSKIIDENIIKKIRSCEKLIKKLYTLKELPYSYTVEFLNVFTLSPYMTIPWIYGGSTNKDDICDKIALGICHTLFIMNDNPSIRYEDKSKYSTNIANKVSKYLNDMCMKNNNFGKIGNSTNQCQILFLDRSFDCRTPLMHDLSLEPMARDLLDIKNNRYDSNPKSKDSLKWYLNNSDNFWCSIKYKHIADAIFEITSQTKEFSASHKLELPDEKISASALRKIMQKYPAYRDEFKKFQTLLLLADSCMEKFRSNNLQDVVKSEQDLATNENEQGQRVPDNPAIYANLLEDMKSSNDKLRLLALFALKNGTGLSKDLLDKMIKLTGVEFASKCLTALEKLDFPILEDSSRNRANSLKRCPYDSSVSSGYDTSRYIPNIWDIIKNFVNQTLDDGLYPFYGDKRMISYEESPSNNFEFGKYSKRTQQSNCKKIKPRLYIFITGGVCYSELRFLNYAMRQFTQAEIIIGGTELFTPNSLIAHLRTM